MVETYSRDAWAELGVDVEFVQHNHSRSSKGTLRGIHFQTEPGQAKLVRCPRGEILDVAVDLRRGSPTFGQWEGHVLDDERHRQLFVPVGFGHGFAVLSEVADVTYLLSSLYDPATEAGIAWDDPDVGVEWRVDEPLLSERDTIAPRPSPRSPSRCRSSTGEGSRALYLAKALAHRVVFAPADLLRRLRGGGELVPPRGLSFVGGGDFTATGREFLGHFTELGGLEPGDRVLDIGCGIGRMAIPLSGYLEGGSYAGFDVGRAMIRWCRRNISPRHPEFEFELGPDPQRQVQPVREPLRGRVPVPLSRLLVRLRLRDLALHPSGPRRGPPLPRRDCEGAEARRHLPADLLPADAGVGGRDRIGSGGPGVHPPDRGRGDDRPGLPEEAVAFDVEEVRGDARRGRAHDPRADPPGPWANAPGAPSYQDIVVADPAAVIAEAGEQFRRDPGVDRGVQERVVLGGLEAAVEAPHAAVEGDLLAAAAGRRWSRP